MSRNPAKKSIEGRIRRLKRSSRKELVLERRSEGLSSLRRRMTLKTLRLELSALYVEVASVSTGNNEYLGREKTKYLAEQALELVSLMYVLRARALLDRGLHPRNPAPSIEVSMAAGAIRGASQSQCREQHPLGYRVALRLFQAAKTIRLHFGYSLAEYIALPLLAELSSRAQAKPGPQYPAIIAGHDRRAATDSRLRTTRGVDLAADNDAELRTAAVRLQTDGQVVYHDRDGVRSGRNLVRPQAVLQGCLVTRRVDAASPICWKKNTSSLHGASYVYRLTTRLSEFASFWIQDLSNEPSNLLRLYHDINASVRSLAVAQGILLISLATWWWLKKNRAEKGEYCCKKQASKKKRQQLEQKTSAFADTGAPRGSFTCICASTSGPKESLFGRNVDEGRNGAAGIGPNFVLGSRARCGGCGGVDLKLRRFENRKAEQEYVAAWVPTSGRLGGYRMWGAMTRRLDRRVGGGEYRGEGARARNKGGSTFWEARTKRPRRWRRWWWRRWWWRRRQRGRLEKSIDLRLQLFGTSISVARAETKPVGLEAFLDVALCIREVLRWSPCSAVEVPQEASAGGKTGKIRLAIRPRMIDPTSLRPQTVCDLTDVSGLRDVNGVGSFQDVADTLPSILGGRCPSP
ncbi:hypothetical protein DFH06DRAFT_1131925 [Mycena polygramma]|nr:hypothetical protein DFH06DRAFT_1131925 [Mycena polygramma]